VAKATTPVKATKESPRILLVNFIYCKIDKYAARTFKKPA